MNKTKIAWTDYTWNPITGCSAVSDGCKNCYAKRVHERFYDYPYSEIRLHFERLEEPLRKRKSCKIFVGSMTDLFQEEISFEWLDYIFHIIMRTPWLTYQILTKRPERLKEYISLSSTKDSIDFVHKGFPNVWFGVTAENQKEAEKRIPILLETDVKNRFVSIEPMLEEIRLETLINQLNWVIVGGETGAKNKVRKMEPDWVEKIYNDCMEHKVPFFFKQWGAFKPEKNFDFESAKNYPN